MTIYTGELVWALAFGSKTADTKPNSINLNWYRYHDAKDLILATGLNSGRIRIWEVKTGMGDPEGLKKIMLLVTSLFFE